MIYSEAAYFDGNHCQHCAAREEHQRLTRARRLAAQAHERRRGSRGLLAAPSWAV